MVKIPAIILSALLLWQSEVPYKPSEEFQLDLDFKFKQRPASDPSTFMPEGNREDFDKLKYGGGPLPYLVANLTILKLAEGETRIKATNGLGEVIISRKAELNKVFSLDLGYTVDMKDRVSPHEYFIYFLSSQKKELSRICLKVEEDGVFLVNEESRGKF